MKVCTKINIKKIETKVLNSRKINIKAILEIEAKVYSNENINIISKINNIDDIQKLECTKKINSLLGEGSAKVYAKDTIEIEQEDDIAEIMKARIKIINKDTKTSYNKILAKADVQVDIMYLTEDNKIKNISCKIPVMGFIDIENISEESICDVDYCIKNLIIKPNTNDLHSIYVEVQIEIECTAYEAKEINLIEDLYSITKDLKYKQKEITSMTDKKNAKEICKITDTINIPEIANNMLYNVQINPIISNEQVRNGKVFYEGNLELELLFEGMSKTESKKVEVPFSFEVAIDNLDKSSTVSTIIEVKQDEFTVNNGSLNINVELEFNVISLKNQSLNVIDEIDLSENCNNDFYSMVIYFVKPGDTLWKIAKNFRSTVDDISKVNGIEDPNKLRIGQQLYIPKFIKKQIAV